MFDVSSGSNACISCRCHTDMDHFGMCVLRPSVKNHIERIARLFFILAFMEAAVDLSVVERPSRNSRGNLTDLLPWQTKPVAAVGRSDLFGARFAGER